VFIVASLEPNRAEQVLFECEGVCGHLAPSKQTRQGVAGGTPDGSGVVGALPAGVHGFPDGVQEFLQGHFRVVGEDGRTIGASPNADGVRAANGLARRLDNQQSVDTFGAETRRSLQTRDWKAGVANQDIGQEGFLVGYQTRADEKNGNFSINEAEVANSLSALWPSDTSHRSMTLVAPSDSIISFPSAYSRQPTRFNDVADPLTLSAGAPAVFRKSSRAQTNEDSETWVEGDVANTLNSFDVGDVRTTHAILGGTADDDSLLPVGLDSHRYRCCGNGVVASVAEWIGQRIVAVDVLD
jgi:site-specific DNA-cytosine methylase